MRCGRATLSYSGITLGSVLWKRYFELIRVHFGQCAVEEVLWATQGSLWQCAVKKLLWATQGSLWRVCCGRACAVEELLWATQGPLWGMCRGTAKLGYSGITLGSVLWKGYFGLLTDHCGQCAVEELLWATQGPLWGVWKGYFGLLRDHSGECAVEELLWATQGPLWQVCCGRATLGYSGTTLGSVLWKSYFGLLRDHFSKCAVEELLWATQGPLWGVCCGRTTLGYSGTTLGSVLRKSYFCGRTTLGYSGTTLGSVLWKSYFGLLRDHSGQCAVEELSWATGRTEVQSSKNLTTPQSYGWGITNETKLMALFRSGGIRVIYTSKTSCLEKMSGHILAWFFCCSRTIVPQEIGCKLTATLPECGFARCNNNLKNMILSKAHLRHQLAPTGTNCDCVKGHQDLKFQCHSFRFNSHN